MSRQPIEEKELLREMVQLELNPVSWAWKHGETYLIQAEPKVSKLAREVMRNAFKKRTAPRA